VEGLLLAAGAGRRMGKPKALVTDERGPWLVRGVEILRAGGCRRVTVVLGAEAARAGALLTDPDVAVTVADDWAEGMGASLRAGLRSLEGSDEDGVVVSLVDLPDLVPEVVTRVIEAGSGPAALSRATYDGSPGHPVLLGRDHWDGVIETAVGDQGARAYLADHAVTLVECGDLASGRDVVLSVCAYSPRGLGG
jgi:CTP:molybdopterin cytidylyltransferase MocA